jgi:hypothetical protein
MYTVQIITLLIIGFGEGMLAMDWYRDKKTLKELRHAE